MLTLILFPLETVPSITRVRWQPYQLFDPNKFRRRFLNQLGLLPFSILFGNDLESQLVSHGMWLELQWLNMRIVVTRFYPKDGKQRTPLCEDGKTDAYGKRLKRKDWKEDFDGSPRPNPIIIWSSTLFQPFMSLLCLCEFS